MPSMHHALALRAARALDSIADVFAAVNCARRSVGPSGKQKAIAERSLPETSAMVFWQLLPGWSHSGSGTRSKHGSAKIVVGLEVKEYCKVRALWLDGRPCRGKEELADGFVMHGLGAQRLRAAPRAACARARRRRAPVRHATRRLRRVCARRGTASAETDVPRSYVEELKARDHVRMGT
jgi:hypothetical protein